jgi:two-component system, cell cycle response regulator DivK
MRPSVVLIIDDDQRNIFALQAVLKSRGYLCLSATSAREGLRKLEERNDIGIVLLDMMMPEMDGYETIEMVRKGKKSDVPILAVTAQAMLGDRERCLDAGASDYISKPIDLDYLTAVLNRLLGKEK